MKNPLNQLILLGLICQGLTWDDYLLPIIYTGLWALGIYFSKYSVRLHPNMETAFLVGGMVLSYLFGRMLGFSTHFSIGHGLAILQIVRLLRPLEMREKAFALIIAIFHLAVVCTFLFDYRFILVFFASIILIPRAFMDSCHALFPQQTSLSGGVIGKISWWVLTLILVISIAVFILFPRSLLTAAIRIPMIRPGETATLLDSVLDPSRSASATPRRILFQVQGEQVGYLRCHVLTEFDGKTWSPGKDRRFREIQAAHPENATGILTRQVHVKAPVFLGRVVPHDGKVVSLRGTFFHRSFETRQEIIETDYMWKGQLNVYEYAIVTNYPPFHLISSEIAMLTKHPPQSTNLQAWVQESLRGITNKYDQAKYLENYFQKNFTYRLGAPELNRLNPTDDFVLNQKTGHCERFASALTVILRMQGIPSRVVIGYLPRRQNLSSSRYDVRMRDAHSWTEAWFPGKGWITLDATPAAQISPPPVWSDWLEALDFAWYAHVVNFETSAQSALFSAIGDKAKTATAWLTSKKTLLLLFCVPFFIYYVWRRLKNRPLLKKAAVRDQKQAMILAEHYYGRMLHILAQHGMHRAPQETPDEFASRLQLPHGMGSIRLVTHRFCQSRYGRHTLSKRDQAEIEEAIKHMQVSLGHIANPPSTVSTVPPPRQ